MKGEKIEKLAIAHLASEISKPQYTFTVCNNNNLNVSFGPVLQNFKKPSSGKPKAEELISLKFYLFLQLPVSLSRLSSLRRQEG